MIAKQTQPAMRYLGTLNNPSQHYEDFIAEDWLRALHSKVEAVYTNGQLEKGQEGTVHLQFYISLPEAKKKRVTALKKICKHTHWQQVGKDNGASSYAMKEDTRLEGPWEFGKKPVDRTAKTDWEQVWQLAKTGKIEEIPADIRARCYNQIKHIQKDHQVIEERTAPKQCYWYYGYPGTGKSRQAFQDNPGAYKKLANKWWDGYTGQKTVVIDDLGKETAQALTYHLKLWADPWQNHPGETKGGQVALTYDKLIVTSNYSMEECFSGIDLQAIKRRFQAEHFMSLRDNLMN